MLRQFLFFFILGCCFFSCLAQDKYIKEAIKQGKTGDNLYHAVIKGNKKVDTKDVINQCKKYNYIYTNLTYKTLKRFGSEDTGVGSFDFLPADELQAYYFEMFKLAPAHSYDALVDEATVYVPLYYPLESLTKITAASWSGSVVNGLAEGNGYGGGFFDDENEMVIFQGTFHQGFPVGNIQVRNIYYQGLNFINLSTTDNNLEIKKASEGLARYVSNGMYGYISNTTGEVIIKPQYKEAGDFAGGKAKVAISKYKFPESDIYKNYSIRDSLAVENVVYYIDKNGRFVDFSEEQKNIFDNRVASIEYQKEQIRLAKLKRQREEQERQQRALMAQRREEEREAAREAAEREKLEEIAMPIARAIAQAGYGKITDQSYYGYWCRISVDVKRPVEGLRVDYILRDAVYYTTDKEIIRDQEFYSKRWYTYEKYTDHWGVPGYDIEIERNTRYKTMYITVEEE